MARLCERPGCSAPAAMSYGFDADRLFVWLAPHDPDEEPLRAGVLCIRHADAMIVPRGWTLDDRRDRQPRLFRTPVASAPPPVREPTRRQRRRRRPDEQASAARPAAAEQLVLDAAGEADTPATAADHELAVAASDLTVAEFTGAPAGGVDDTVAMPWRPEFDESDDLDGLLAADSPLLARAFRGAERPEPGQHRGPA